MLLAALKRRICASICVRIPRKFYVRLTTVKRARQQRHRKLQLPAYAELVTSPYERSPEIIGVWSTSTTEGVVGLRK